MPRVGAWGKPVVVGDGKVELRMDLLLWVHENIVTETLNHSTSPMHVVGTIHTQEENWPAPLMTLQQA